MEQTLKKLRVVLTVTTMTATSTLHGEFTDLPEAPLCGSSPTQSKLSCGASTQKPTIPLGIESGVVSIVIETRWLTR